VNTATKTSFELFKLTAKNGHFYVIRDLMKIGASVKIKKNKHVWAPFITAAENGHLKVVQLLLNQVAN
jgi:ankyrin repeat protein